MRGDGDHSYGGTEGYPHIHVECHGGQSAIISIKDRSVSGSIPTKDLSVVIDWMGLHEKELMDNWESLHQPYAKYTKIDGHVL